ncbi:MAG: hypothetical protein ABI867_09375 [Kofleriaceae bacterium]
MDKFTQRLHVEPVDEPLRLTMESCRLDVDACPALCTLALGRYGISGAVTQSCTVSFGDDHATLFVKYTKDTGQCGFADDVAF